MEDLKLVPFGDPKLKLPPSEFDFNNDNPKELKNILFQKMYELKGIGLSANQIGLDKRVFVIGGPKIAEKAFFNPTLVSVSKHGTPMREGCLSYPGLWLTITRPSGCVISYHDENNELVVEEYHGIEARIILHEYDHMVGQNFTMRASKLKLERALKHLDKKVKQYYSRGIR